MYYEETIVKVKAKLLLGFGIMACIVAIVAAFNFYVAHQVNRLRGVELPMEQNLRKVEVSIWEAIHAADAFRFTADPVYERLYFRQLGEVDEFYLKYLALISTSEEKQYAEEFNRFWAEGKAAGGKILEFIQQQREAEETFYAEINFSDEVIDSKIQAEFSPEDPHLLAKEQSLREVEVSIWEAIHAAMQYTSLTPEIPGTGSPPKTYQEFMEKQFKNVDAFWAKYKTYATSPAEREAIREFETHWKAAVPEGRQLVKLQDKIQAEFNLLYQAADKTGDVINDKMQGFIQKRIEQRNSQSRQVTARGMVLAIGSFILAICISLVLTRLITVPLGNLANVAKEIERDNFSARAEVSAGDEIGELAKSFNRMADELEKSRGEMLFAKAYVENVVNSMADALIVVDLGAQIQTVNQAACQLLGYEKEEFLGKSVSLIAIEERIFKDTELKKLARKGVLKEKEMMFTAKSGERIPVLVTGSMLLGEKKREAGIVMMAQDMRQSKKVAQISKLRIKDREKSLELEVKSRELEERRGILIALLEDANAAREKVERREKQLKETQEMLVQAGKLTALGQLGAGVAHELNQPIAAILGFSQLSLTQIPPDHLVAPHLKLIEEQSKRMAKIVDNIRSFVRDSHGSHEVISLNQPIVDALMLMTVQLKGRGIVVETQLDSNLPLIVADSNELQQVFLNLLTNARDAVMEKGLGGKIQIATFADGSDWVVAKVSDTGTGIREEIRERIFDPFFTTKPPGKGTGLGLAIVSSIMTNHQGTIAAESIPGGGAMFVVKIPVVKEQKKQDTKQKLRAATA